MKWLVIGIVEGMPPARRRAFLDALDLQLCSVESPPIVRFVESQRRMGSQLVLATAAPDIYARSIARRLGFDECIATSMGNPLDRVEMSGRIKADYCRRFLEVRGPFDRVYAVSDHTDDVELMRLADEVIVHGNPLGYRLISEMLGRESGVTLVDNVSEQENGGIWLWMAEQYRGPLTVWETKTILSKHRYALLYVGGGKWRRARPGVPIGDACPRVDPPIAPGVVQRLRHRARYDLVRRRMGVYH